MDYLQITDFGNRNSDSFCAAERIEKTLQNKDCGGDYILPDYLPDAKKVVGFTARPLLETRFCGKGSLEYSGTVYFRLIYLCENGELRACSFTMPFEDRLTSENISDDCVDFIKPHTASLSCRLQNSRKVKASVRLSTDIEIWKRECFLPELYGTNAKRDISSLQTNPGERQAMNVTNLREDEMTINEDILLDKSLPDISEIIFSDINIIFDECRGGKKEIICRGGADFSCIFKGNDGKYYFVKRNIPISESIISDNANEESVCFANVLCKSPDLSLREDEFGQMRIIELNMTYSLEICIYNRKNILITGDAYSTACECRNDFADITLCRNEEKIGGNFSVNESMTLKELGIGTDDNIVAYFSSGEMSLQNSPGKHGKMNYEGKCKLNIILQKPDMSFYPVTAELPLRFESERKYKENTEYEDKTCCRIIEMRLRSDGEKLFADGEIGISSSVIICDKMTILSAIRLIPSSEKVKDKALIIVCYPCKEDDIWKIAKKYGVSRESIAIENKFSGDELPQSIRIP